MLSKIPANAKPVFAIVCLALAAVVLWFVLNSGQKPVADPIVIDLSDGKVQTMSHDQFRRTVARSGNDRRIFPIEANGNGGLRIHNRYRRDFIEVIESYGITREQAAAYLDFSNDSWPSVKDEFVPDWARSLEGPAEGSNQDGAGTGQDSSTPADR